MKTPRGRALAREASASLPAACGKHPPQHLQESSIFQLKDEHEIGSARPKGERDRRMRRPGSGRLPFLVFGLEGETRFVVARGGGKVGNLVFVFHFSRAAKAGLWECGNLVVWTRFPRGGGKGGKAAFAFPGFPRTRHFHGPPVRYRNGGGTGACTLQCRSSRALAAFILRAHSVSLTTSASRSNSAQLEPGLRYCSARSRDGSFSKGVR